MCQIRLKMEINRLFDDLDEALAALEQIDVSSQAGQQMRQKAILAALGVREKLIKMGLRQFDSTESIEVDSAEAAAKAGEEIRP